MHQGRLLGVLRVAILLKLFMVGRLSSAVDALENLAPAEYLPFEEYLAVVIVGKRNSTFALDSATHRVLRIPVGHKAGAAVYLRRPRLIDVRFTALELLQGPLAQPFLHNRLSHSLQSLPGKRMGGTPPRPSVQSRTERPRWRNMLCVKLDDMTLRRSSGHVRAIADTGLHVNVGLFLFDAAVDDLSPAVTEHPRITLSAHSGGWKHAFWGNALDGAPLASGRLAAAEHYQNSFFDQLGLEPSPFANLHFYALQQDAIPYLLNTGPRASIMYAGHRPDGTFGPRVGRDGASYALGRTSEGLLIVSGEDHNGWRYNPANTWDVLKRTSSLSGRGDVAKGTERILRAARNAFEHGMPAILSTHEFRLVRYTRNDVHEMFSTAIERLTHEGYDPCCVSETELLASLTDDLDGGVRRP